ncbi:MAG: cellulase family glycosylhydrolase [Candidatus Omnitrophica bacterium]|nr:cellulase family glycosylhydrolase [Candidatus Omnitrophota bacterium]
MKTIRKLNVYLLLSMICASFAFPDQPIRLHPRNPHYFMFREKPTILITSAEHYGAVLNLDFDYIPYLEALQKDGMNLTRTFSGAYCEKPGEFNIEKNTLAPFPNRFICPWARSEQPGYRFGGNKFDLSSWDDAYFRRLKDFVDEAGKRDVVVELVFFCPFYNPTLWTFSPMNSINNINGYSSVSSTEAYALQDVRLTAAQDAMVRKIVEELNPFDNLYYEICNEPYFGGVTFEWQKHISETIVKAESALPNKHLISQNIANGSAVIDDPNPNVSIFNYHYAYPPEAVAQNYHLNRAIGYNESGFSGRGDDKYRGDAWAFIIAGGGLFNNLDYSFTVEYENGIAGQNAPGGGSPALRKQLKILQDFMQSFDFIRMKPNHSLLTSIRGNPETRGWALANEGKEYAVYLRKGNKAAVSLQAPQGVYFAEWMNTITGKIDQSLRVNHPGGDITLESPEYVEGIALRIKKADS